MECDFLVVGGGLAGTLAALAVAERQPQARLCLVEHAPRLGGNHTWSFHGSDLSPEERAWVAPFISHHWPTHEVRFPIPGRSRQIAGPYCTVTSRHLTEMATARLRAAGATLIFGADAVVVEPGRACLRDGRELRAGLVLDARGGELPGSGMRGMSGFQTFVGLEVELDRDADLPGPLLMDATVEQTDGYRFMYVLPFEPRRWLVEDTVYGDAPVMDPVAARAGIHRYLARRGLHVRRVLREERGVLPIPWAQPRATAAGATRIGYRGGFFHPTTGYSFALAVEVARAVASAPRSSVDSVLTRVRRARDPQRRFCRMLNRLLFRAVPPAARWRIFARFYQLPEDTIARFYALSFTRRDRLRILAGRPLQDLALLGPAAPEVLS
jgi:lycopene beta-cyclase